MIFKSLGAGPKLYLIMVPGVLSGPKKIGLYNNRGLLNTLAFQT